MLRLRITESIRAVARSHIANVRIATLVLCSLCFLATAVPVRARQAADDSKDMIGWVPREILERPLPLRQGIGVVHEKVTTSSPDAQAYYDQGVAYVHSFVWIEAARSFNQALRLDPSLAMADLGLSDVYIGLQDVHAARAAFDKAQSLSGQLSAQEKARITIRARQLDYLDGNGDMQKYFAYRQAIADALAVDPGNSWLWILRGFADEGTPFGHGQGGHSDTVAFYDAALASAPDSFVPHHYLAHTFENMGLAKLALEQSEIYVRLAPAIPHAHHMRGHDLRQLGRTDEAIQEFVKTNELENAYYKAENIPARYDWHHAHNLTLLAMSYQSLGQMKAAESAFREAYSMPAYSDLAEFNRRSWPEFLLDRGRPQEALEQSQDLIGSKWALARFAGHTVAGRALLALNRTDDAKLELSLAEQESEKISSAVLALLPNAGALNAEILLREKNWDRANPLMNQIEDKIHMVPGPDAWCEALFELESIAKVAQQVGDWDLAESTAKKMIQHDPTYAGGHYIMGAVAEHRGDGAEAKQEFATADRLWSKADPDAKPHVGQNP
jgi:tetratricopeptide (TPR) repeat protein